MQGPGGVWFYESTFFASSSPSLHGGEQTTVAGSKLNAQCREHLREENGSFFMNFEGNCRLVFAG
jgi:hypothetical protein